MKYSDIFLEAEKQYSEWNFSVANTEIIFRHFDDAEKMCQEILGMVDCKKKSPQKKNSLVQPAYDQCIKASHLFNVLDARGVISTAQRQVYIGRVRALAKLCADAYVDDVSSRV